MKGLQNERRLLIHRPNGGSEKILCGKSFLTSNAKGRNTLRNLNGSLQTSTLNDGQHKGNHQTPVVAVSRFNKRFGLS